MTCTLFSIRRRISILALTAVIALLTACGQKGPLTLPGNEGSDTRQPQDVDTGPQASPVDATPAATTAPTTTAPANAAPETTVPATTE